MTVSYLLAPEPIWYIVNKDGTPSGGAYMNTKSNLNFDLDKPVYTDATGSTAWPNPITFDLNGTQGPFYFAVDSANLDDTYFLEVFDVSGNSLWTVKNFFPAGTGGGGNTTTILSTKNYITNNQFINHIADHPTKLPTNIVIAPSNHKGFTPSLVNPVVGTYGVLGSDIRFNKNNSSANDSIEFPVFALSAPDLTPDNTPSEYVHYVSDAGTGEAYKNFQFPISQKVKNLSNQPVTFTIWAKVTATPVTLSIYSRQYYGSGTAATIESTATRPIQGTCLLSTSWKRFLINFNIPNVAGNSLGTPGAQTDDDALYIQVEMPLNAACDVLFTKPCLYLGTIVNPTIEFDSYDQIDSIDSTPRCGDIRTSLSSSPPPGWLAMNDTTIGNTGSGATTGQTGAQFFALYKTIWDGVFNNTWAPVSGGYGATALADFLAGKTLTLPRSLGRALAGAGAGSGLTPSVLGQYGGLETHTLLAGELPPHNHTVSALAGTNVNGAQNFMALCQTSVTTNTGFTVGNGPGASTPFSIIQPTSYMNVFIKL